MQQNLFFRKMILFFRYIAAEEDTFLGGEQMLFEMLHIDFFRVPGIEVATISVEADDRRRKGEPASIRGLLRERAHRPPVDLFDPGLHPSLVQISDTIELLINQQPCQGIQLLYEQLVRRFNLEEYTRSGNLVEEFESFALAIKKASEENAFMRARELVYFLRDELSEWSASARKATTPVLQSPDRFFISKRLEKFVMNVSALNNYLQCPLKFYYQNILRIPAGKSEAQGFGSAMHYAMEKLFEKMKQHPGESFPTKAEMTGDFISFMLKTREIFSQDSFERKMAHGEKVIDRYYDKYINSWKKIVLTESMIRNVNLRGVPLKGILDKIEFTGSEVNIVDYKTGSYERALAHIKGPEEENPHGGDYWRQAVFYHLLVELRPGKPWIPVSTEFDFIEPDITGEFRKLKLYITSADKETVRQQIVETWRKIMDHDFYTGCNKENCYWCSIAELNI